MDPLSELAIVHVEAGFEGHSLTGIQFYIDKDFALSLRVSDFLHFTSYKNLPEWFRATEGDNLEDFQDVAIRMTQRVFAVDFYLASAPIIPQNVAPVVH